MLLDILSTVISKAVICAAVPLDAEGILSATYSSSLVPLGNEF